MSFLSALSLLLIYLKLTKQTNVPWAVALTPAALPFVFGLVFFLSRAF